MLLGVITSAVLLTVSTMTATLAFSFSATAVFVLISFNSFSASALAAAKPMFFFPSSTWTLSRTCLYKVDEGLIRAGLSNILGVNPSSAAAIWATSVAKLFMP